MKTILKKFHKNMLRMFLLTMTVVVPVQAYAFDCASCYYSGFAAGCSECAAVMSQLSSLIDSSTLQIRQDIKESTTAINDNIDGTRQTLSEKIDTATAAIVAALEKSDGAQKELKQADLNYKAATITAKAGADAQDMFTQPSADLMNPKDPANTCSTMATSVAATAAGNNAAITARSLTAAQTRKGIYTSNVSGTMQREIQTYNTNFCSDLAEKRGTCTKVADDMQDADQSAGSLLAPVAGRTYSDPESIAAKQFISNVVGPLPQESLPIVMEKTPAGQRYLVEQRAMASLQSMASFSLNTIYANNSADDTSSGAAAGSKISVVGLMKKFVEDKFGSPVYADSLAGLNENGLLKQIAMNMAFQNWMDYYQYLQGERIEGVLASGLALSARERSEKVLSSLRQQAASR